MERKSGNVTEQYATEERADSRNSHELSEMQSVVQRDFPVFLTGPHYKKYPSYKSFRRQTREPKRLVRRLIKKNGGSNVYKARMRNLWDRYMRDLGHTIVDSRWRWTVLSLSSSFLLSWFIFAVAWMLIANVNGDLDPDSPSPTPCLVGNIGFGGYMMFSIETQQTIGYGSRYITNHCPEGTFLMCLQIILGCAICGAMVSIVNAKMVRPFQMYSKGLFSKKAVICLRDGTLCLIFRVRDENGRYAIGTTVNAYLVQSRPEEPFLKSLALEKTGLLIWPLEVVHKITPSSPFYDLSAKELITKRFEIIATMEGTSASTGQCSKTRTSYLSTEILWGCAFKSCIYYSGEANCYTVNHDEFNTTREILTPLCSAQRLSEVLQDIASVTDIPYNFADGELRREQLHNHDLEDNDSDADGEQRFVAHDDDDDNDSVYDNIPRAGKPAFETMNSSTCDVDVEELLTSLANAVKAKR
ncbi:G protein-activated inward rectifier potassium channel 3-like isoform X1 [Atheta coriaria]|uniref:G protein-activated inward rectifier potassium channel 3-like isoform X1 n=2 Tax=Dalotia coriaria TaxID=877792 RepID=UPI0031F40341